MSLQQKLPIILASGSHARNEMLKNAGVEFEKISADIDENIILKQMQSENAKPCDIALELAKAKAVNISAENPDGYVIGSDQVLECEGRLFQKAYSENEARQKLKNLRGKTHSLISSVAVAKNSEIIWSNTDKVTLKMHHFDDEFLEQYMTLAKNDILQCVGAYAFENHGAWLFEEINGNYFTILGMPLLPLLAFLRD